MKKWSTGHPDPKGDLHYDEVPTRPLTITEQYMAMRWAYRAGDRAHVNEVLETLGLRKP